MLQFIAFELSKPNRHVLPNKKIEKIENSSIAEIPVRFYAYIVLRSVVDTRLPRSELCPN